MKNVRRVPKLCARRSDAHKGDFGRVVIVAGSRGMLGAAVLCARAATRGGAGLVRVGLPAELVPLLPLSVPEAMTFAVGATELNQQLAEADAVVIGPGLTPAASTRQQVRLVLKQSEVPAVLDADALNVLAPLRAPLSCRAPVILTPHPGEAARLLGSSTREVQKDRRSAVAELCKASGAIVVLKGEGTLVADGQRCYRNQTGNPGMASGGSGDVLAGLLGAMLARTESVDAFEAACLAVHVHGRAGDLARDAIGENGMVASDLVNGIAEVLS